MRSALVRKMSSLVVLPVAVLALASCDDATGPRLPNGVEIRPVSNVFPVEVVGGIRRVTVTAVIENDSDRAIYYSYCSEKISKRIGGVWTAIWSPLCPAILVPPEAIEAGSSKFLVIQVIDVPNFPAIKFPFDDSEADYRLDVGLLLRSRAPGDNDKFLKIDGSRSASRAFSVVPE